MKTHRRTTKAWYALLVAASLAPMSQVQSQANPPSYTGSISTIEVWQSGNVAFRLWGISGTCASGDWFVINKSMAGMKNLHASLLAAKFADKPIRVYASTCAAAENFTPTYMYLIVDYLYID